MNIYRKGIKLIKGLLLDSLNNFIYIESLNDPLFWVKYKMRVMELAIINFERAMYLFKDPLLSTLKLILTNPPWMIKYRDGHVFTSFDPWKFYDLRSRPYAEFITNYNGKRIKLIHAERGEAEEVFIGGTYSWLPVRGQNCA